MYNQRTFPTKTSSIQQTIYLCYLSFPLLVYLICCVQSWQGSRGPTAILPYHTIPYHNMPYHTMPILLCSVMAGSQGTYIQTAPQGARSRHGGDMVKVYFNFWHRSNLFI